MSEPVAVDLVARGLRCTLPEPARDSAVLEWQDMGALATTVETLDNGVRLTLLVRHAAQVTDLVDRENACCGSWLHATTSVADEVVTLTIVGSTAAGVEVIHGMTAGTSDATSEVPGAQ